MFIFIACTFWKAFKNSFEILFMYDDDEGGEYEYFETPEDVEEDSRESYVKKMIKPSKEQDGFLRRPDYKPSSISKELDEKEYQPPPREEQDQTKEEKPKTGEKKKEEYEL